MLNRFAPIFAAAALALAPAVTSQNTIADLVVLASGGATAGQFDNDDRDYDMLLTALTAADLVNAVADPQANLTVFAPNDAAFIRLANDLGYVGNDESDAWDFLVQALTNLGNGNPIPVLTDVLLYHVVPERISLIGVVIRSFFRVDIDTALAGVTITPRYFRLRDKDPEITDPRVRWPLNIFASNGVIHTIDRVLLPIDL